jgi:hypothetical protein
MFSICTLLHGNLLVGSSFGGGEKRQRRQYILMHCHQYGGRQDEPESNTFNHDSLLATCEERYLSLLYSNFFE